MSEEFRPPPEGFEPSLGRGAFTLHNGPVYFRRCSTGAEHGFWVLPRHCNSFGIIHGGMIATFLDGLIGAAVFRTAKAPAVTVHLSIDYMAMARAGEWLEGRAAVTRSARDMVFAEAGAFVRARAVARATSVFKLMDRPRP